MQNWVIVRENHKSGEILVHVYLKLLKKAVIKEPTFLDLQDNLDKYHGNYQSARKPNSVIEDMLKISTLYSELKRVNLL